MIIDSHAWSMVEIPLSDFYGVRYLRDGTLLFLVPIEIIVFLYIASRSKPLLAGFD